MLRLRPCELSLESQFSRFLLFTFVAHIYVDVKRSQIFFCDHFLRYIASFLVTILEFIGTSPDHHEQCR